VKVSTYMGGTDEMLSSFLSPGGEVFILAVDAVFLVCKVE